MNQRKSRVIITQARLAIACVGLFWAVSVAAAPSKADSLPESADPKALLAAWKSNDNPNTTIVSVPSRRPVDSFRYTSTFGMRTDPFNHNRSFHPGVDLAAPIGTPVYATGDAIVGRAGPAAGYGNLIVLFHGAGIETRYGHLSRILVKVGQTVRRGDRIGLVGSTGRSTGSHLHYEIRVGDQIINPLPFMAPGDEQLALNESVGQRAGTAIAMGGPAAPDNTKEIQLARARTSSAARSKR